MKTTRRGFGTIALGAAVGAISGTTVFSRKANAQTRAAHAAGVYDNGIIQLNQNESARGPGPSTMDAIHSHTTKRVGRGYSPDHVNELRQGIADYYSISIDNVQLATGSTPLLQGSVRAFCDADKTFVTPMPTYSTSLGTARTIGAATIELPLGSDLGVDLDDLANNADGAGLLYLCNPNNPTGTVHGPAAVEAFVRRVMRENPDTYVHIDEAYINYTRAGAMETALPLAMEFDKVFITRSFSKAHGLAGMRIGYALAQEETLAKIRGAWGMGDVNMLGAIAALSALEDKEHIAWEAQENAEIRDEVVGFFRSRGHEVPDSNTNHIFVNIGMPAAKFREGCLEHNVLVGRDFPPLEQTHCRISLGSREEMKVALEVFAKVLG
ncbi:MAG: aminotransferase class I/II-fold pyridoxal phosphate-dependent enzyme [Pseudomonadales bacterium]|nr:aminotransferase class I/II-fold pyridoxal phosphate-dependent enzyme [Pseudomonadales bacterium]